MLTLRTVEFHPLSWLDFSFGEAAIWVKRFELGYLNPFMLSTFYQAVSGDTDNLLVHGSLSLNLPSAKLYGNLVVDEIGSQGSRAPDMKFSEYLKNIYAFSTGVQIAIPFLPFTMLSFQYTKIEPYCYTHYDQLSPHQGSPVRINFTHQGYNIARSLPPNSDESLVRIDTVPLPGMDGRLEYRLIRHGNNVYGYGDINRNWYEIQTELGTLKKDFLNDGVYDISHLASVEIGYQFKSLPIRLEASYQFSYTYWIGNGYESAIDDLFWTTRELEAPLENVVKHIFSIRLELFN